MAKAPSRVVELIETFDRNIEAYRSQQYNEAQLRREFIDPFFEELGWDVTNKAGHAQAYKDVIHEDAIKIGGFTKAPDYCFRIGGTRKFFLEAKKPSIDISGDPHPAYQLRRYAWSAKLPLSILTDFEEFAVYDCQIRPKHTDKASAARIKYLTYKEYIEKWGDISDIFSKDAILKGSFDKFAVSTKGKRGTTTVDKEFLSELEKWRSELARVISLRNSKLSQYEINFAVQRTIDRILFLRMCEDRGIEDYGQLLKISSGSQNYPRLFEVFEKADHKYNSGLFYFHKETGRPEGPDELTPNITVDDNTLKYMLHSLYYPQCPYEFSVLPAEILGNVYEQFLGKVIELTPAHRAEVKEKPEVKKAGGVYYTPSYIVDYIVKNTIGKLCEGKTPKDISKLRILDPACGSGSFLLGAYTYMLDYHRDWYVANNPEKYKKQIYQGRGNQWFLTIAEKKKILLNNIFGVDIDSQAVEVTKLSLLLKVLEGETGETVGQTYKIFHERALPDLGNNIKCGNSLIGPDFFDTVVIPSEVPSRHSERSGAKHRAAEESIKNRIADDLRRKINPFDWHSEFPKIFSGKNPGFDAVIGNPPYGAFFTTVIRHYLSKQYKLPIPITDSFILFLLKSLTLLRSGGLQSFIIPSTWLYMPSYASFRKMIMKNSSILRLVLFRSPVFEQATVETCIETICKTISENNIVLYEVKGRPYDFYGHKYERSQDQVLKESQSNLCFCRKTELQNIFERIQKTFTPLSDLSKIVCGLTPYRKGKGKPPQTQKIVKGRLFDSDTKKDATYRCYIMGRDFDRYKWQLEKKRWISYGDWLAEPRYKAPFNDDLKIVIRQTADSIIAHLDDNRFLSFKNVHNLRITSQKLTYQYLLGLLNSNLITYWYQYLIPEKGRVFAEVKVVNLKKLPIRTIDFDNPDDKAKHDKMVELVERMLDLHKKMSAAKVPAEKTRIQRQINNTDKQIDNLVYDLYNLTEEEIRIVEQNNNH